MRCLVFHVVFHAPLLLGTRAARESLIEDHESTIDLETSASRTEGPRDWEPLVSKSSLFTSELAELEGQQLRLEEQMSTDNRALERLMKKMQDNDRLNQSLTAQIGKLRDAQQNVMVILDDTMIENGPHQPRGSGLEKPAGDGTDVLANGYGDGPSTGPASKFDKDSMPGEAERTQGFDANLAPNGGEAVHDESSGPDGDGIPSQHAEVGPTDEFPSAEDLELMPKAEQTVADSDADSQEPSGEEVSPETGSWTDEAPSPTEAEVLPEGVRNSYDPNSLDELQ